VSLCSPQISCDVPRQGDVNSQLSSIVLTLQTFSLSPYSRYDEVGCRSGTRCPQRHFVVFLHFSEQMCTLHITCAECVCLNVSMYGIRRSEWPRGLRRSSAVARLLRLWVRIPPGAWMSVCWDCCVLSKKSLCDELIARPEQSYRLWCVVVCNLETS